MTPMSRKKRSIYFFGLSVVFLLLLPVVILYAVGYRLGNVSWFNLTKTGGIFVSAERSGVEVSVDGAVEKKTGIFQHSFLISGLKPGLHDVLVKADGYNEWLKKVDVFAEKVTEINPYLIPDQTILKPISPYVTPDGSVITATSTIELKKITNKLPNPDYVAALKLFNSSNLNIVATSSRDLFTSANFDFSDKKGLIFENKLALWQEKDNLVVEWLGDEDGIPYYFCSDEICNTKIQIPVGRQISHFDFYPGKNNYVVIGLADGIYVYELDARSSAQNKALLVAGKNLDFRTNVTGTLYIKDTKDIYIAGL